MDKFIASFSNMQELQENIDIHHLSNFKTKAQAKYFFQIKSEDCVKMIPKIQDFVLENNLDMLFVGGGTNMFFAFDTFHGVVIKNSLEGWEYDKDTKLLESYSNESIWKIAESLEKDFGQDLWHRFIGLPGSLGGAIFGNAGCFGLEIENNLIEVTVLNIKTGQIEILGKNECDFSYRNSLFKKTENYFIIKAKFDLSEKKEKYHSDVDNIYFREHKQPKGNTCGSFFKNPIVDRELFFKKFPDLCEDCVKIISAGFLLESVGLKGYRLGNAYFSEKHSNFLMSDDDGEYNDLLDLIELAQKKVQESFGILLENEVRIIHNKA